MLVKFLQEWFFLVFRSWLKEYILSLNVDLGLKDLPPTWFFSVRQLQEKFNEQNMPLYIAFIDLTKAFDLVSREGLFAILLKIGCPPNLFNIVKSFHTNKRATIQYDGSVSDSLKIKSWVKQGCVLALTLFGIFFSMLLKHAFNFSKTGIKLHTRTGGHLSTLQN